ncbi:V-set and transmembrane domain-containing protein 2-like protein [Pseudoliparis swirei]|uniref:V-set and transmembrane domain-containing protein 2-like protein n=1 Tax=Pseudoliparis swirei TaxID=2059687 RepID=UPI0024BD68DE|nr:V-set and transmembrane domain-containing protein 2-like protein [Pseudoliparis swirei]
MGALGVVMRLLQVLQSLQFLQYAGLYVDVHAALSGGDGEPENRISGNALFTEVPRDVATQSGQDVEMACSFRGAGSPSHLLEIQWWYTKDHEDQQEEADQIILNNVAPLEETSRGATKISVVKVAGSNISHKLRLSGVTPADEGTYECRVIDFSSGAAGEGRHRAHARLQVAPERSRAGGGRRGTARRRRAGD